jgi:hypothetical protein
MRNENNTRKLSIEEIWDALFSGESGIKMLITYILFVIVGILALGFGCYRINGLNHTTTTLESLLEKKNVEGFVKCEVKYSSPAICKVENKIGGFISVSTKYYYILYTKDKKHAILLEADEDWGKQFNPDTGEAIQKVVLEGEVSGTLWEAEQCVKNKGIAETMDGTFIYKDCIDSDARKNARSCIAGGAAWLWSMFSLAMLYITRKQKLAKTFGVLFASGVIMTILCILGFV